MLWYFEVIGLCCALAIFLVFKESRRTNRSRLSLRIISTLIAVASLAALALPLTRPYRHHVPDFNQIVVLTEGSDPDSVKHFLNGRDLPVYTTDTNTLRILKQFAPKIVSSLEFLVKTQPTAHLDVFGYGFDAAELQKVPQAPMSFHPSPIPAGVASIDWSPTLFQGEKLRVQGKSNNPENKRIKLVLRGLNTDLDSLIIDKRSQIFELTAVPKHLGSAIYSLVTLDGRDTLAVNPVPVNVEAAEPLNILILAASPNFEYRFLKSWLVDRSFGVATRTRISKDKFDQDFVNLAPTTLDKISSGKLAEFDVVLADHEELGNLPDQELAAIRTQVQQESMGLIVKIDTTGKSLFYSKFFPVGAAEGRDQPLELKLVQQPQQKFTVLEEQPGYLLQTRGTQPLLQDNKGRIVVNSKLYGTGTLLNSTLNSSFRLILADKNDAYSSLWSLLISKAARKKRPATQWTSDRFPRQHEPVQVGISRTTEEVPKLTAESVILKPEQNRGLRNRWRGIYWPETAGWTTFTGDDGSTVSSYVYSAQDWSVVRAIQRREATTRAATNAGRTQTTLQEVVEKKPIPKIIFFLILLCSMGFLWYEAKIL